MDYKLVKKESFHSWMQVQSGFTAVEEQEETGIEMFKKQAMKAGVGMVSKEMMTRSVSSGGQEAVKTGIQTVTKEVIEDTLSIAGKEVVKITTTKEVLTQGTSKSASNTVALGVACGAVIEGITAYYDISCARENMKEGKISSGEYNKFVGKRVMTGCGSVGGSSLGTLLGQAVIPIPFVGGLVGSVVGGLVGSVTVQMLL